MSMNGNGGVVRRRRVATASVATVSLLATALLVGTMTAPGAVASTGDLSDAGARGFADVASCAAGADHLLAAVVVDESGSLQQTDPDDLRVGAILTALDSLAGLQTSAGDRMSVEANLGVFGTTYSELVGWGPVTGPHGDELASAADEQIPSRNKAKTTDYRAALRGAQASLDARGSSLGGETCKVVLWFTDGKLDLGDISKDGLAGPATEAARTELCSAQGIADVLRGDGIAIVALALFTEGAGSTVTELDREQLRAVAEGTGGSGTSCGTVPVSAHDTGGAYLRADQPDALRRLFAGAGALIEGGTPGLSVNCPDALCVDGVLPIATDIGVGRFRAVLEVATGAQTPTLFAPDGSQVPLAAGTSQLAGADVVTTSRDGLITVDVVFPGHGSAGGQWRLTTDPATSTVIDLYYFWGIALDVQAPDGLVIGETHDVTVTPRHGDGEPVDPTMLGTLDVSLLVDGSDVPLSGRDDGTFVASVAIPGGGAASEIAVEATARATTVPSNIALGPVTTSITMPTALPPSYPSVTPTSLVLPAMVGDEAATGTITLTGSDRGDTRACFGASALEGPQDAGTVTASADEPCVDVPSGETVTVGVSLSAEHPADGRVQGVLPVTLTGVDAAQDITVDLAVSSSMVRPVDEGKRWGFTAGLVLLALLIAYLVAHLSRLVSDRYSLGGMPHAASIPVTVSNSGVVRSDEPTADLPGVDDFHRFHVAGRTGRFDIAGLHFGRSFSWVNPWSSARCFVRGASGDIVVTNGRNGYVDDEYATRAPVTLPGVRQFYLVVTPGRPDASTVDARLVLLVDGTRGLAEPSAAWRERLADYPSWPEVFSAIVTARAARSERAAEARPGRADGARSPAGTAGSPAPAPAMDRTAAPPSIFDSSSAGQVDPPPGARSDRSSTAPLGPPGGTELSSDDRRPPSIFDND
ncbi:hypothetical protein [Oerskovia sp. Root22]|uniref:hypothetical protein n=1 Tax=Oerskovia sp. Root22 TaxID=1736494 RepID=UPI000A4E03A5|nr:hypothetical protein [Oerskovia sp. Root22]